MRSQVCRFVLFGSAPLVLLCAAAVPIAAQNDGVHGPPNVLLIQREYLKPGKGGNIHVKSEGAFVKAMSDAKYPTHYFAMDALSGPTRALFFVGYESFAALEKDNWAMRKNKVLSEAVDRATLADGDLLTSFDSSVLALRPDLSRMNRGLHGVRYFELSLYVVRPGHLKEWDELVKIYMDGYAKAVPESNWDTFQLVYGSPTTGPGGDTFLVVIPIGSLAQTDQMLGDDKKFMDAIGTGGQRRLAELSAASIESQTTNLFEFNPHMSYPPPEWIADEPDFWKAAPAPVKKAAAKPAQ